MELITETQRELLDNKNSQFYDKLVPPSGKSDTEEGEMLRAINKIIYRFYNDGDFFFKGYGCETAGPAHAYLVSKSPLRKDISKMFLESLDEDRYDTANYKVLEKILTYIESREGYAKNNFDMLDCKPIHDDTCSGCREYTSSCRCEDDYEKDSWNGY